MSYATAMQVSGGYTDITVNYFSVMLKPSMMNWLTSLQSDIIDSWDNLKRMFIENYKATCEQPGTKHDQARFYQKPS